MSWDAYIFGELAFPAGAIARWHESPAVVAQVPWPRMIAQALFEPDDDEEDEEIATVAEALALSAKLNHYFGSIDVAGDAVRIAFCVDNSNYWMVCDPVVRVVSAAAAHGATGSVRFMDCGDAIALGHFTGARAAIGNGKVTADARDEPLTGPDVEYIRAAVETAMETAKAASAAVTAELKPKPKLKLKLKPRPKPKLKLKPKPKAKPKRR